MLLLLLDIYLFNICHSCYYHGNITINGSFIIVLKGSDRKIGYIYKALLLWYYILF